MARTRLYRDGVLTAEDFPAADISDHLHDPAATVWLDLCSPGEQDMAMLGEELSLHGLALADAVTEHLRPKLARYDTHAFLAAYAVRLDDDGTLRKYEVAAFITPKALVTVRKTEGFDIDDVVRRWDAADELAKSGVGFLVHGLLDFVVDSHLEAVRALDEQIESLEDMVFEDAAKNSDVQRRALLLRRSLVTLRQVVLPMREIATALARRDYHLADDALVPYFQDIHDHVLHATEWTESLRELVNTIRETQLTLQGNRLNTIMKKVTSWAAIIAVPTAITGFYGQNVPYPGFDRAWGFWVSTVAILVVSGALYRTFKHRDWL